MKREQGGQDMDKKILIADDEASIRNALAYALKREGFLVETAVDGEDALEKYVCSIRMCSYWM